MKKQSIFSGIILVGIGCYLLLQQLKIPVFPHFYSWQTLIIIVGIAFLVQAYSENDHSNIVPGVILVGFGLHFHGSNQLPFWPKHYGMLLLIIAIGLLLKYVKTKNGLLQGGLLLVLSLLLLYFDRFMNWLNSIQGGLSFIINYWPLLLIGGGFYLLFIKKK
ncbi:LiaI-LiaF-like domain-containing protein [Ferdinandcohnia quinoae]|uniref:DUF5668 domain-containing protein n=1 Tax=Fredinandcohnia quinoae TaxID=2918902 RepID=A0AAW5E9P0_9BACI|nr:DUF5668 domain-containing protein [Fredinandcohnia sp. SECRCQ15]MCH1626602.1 DUF5668 domain-containing protein [Fredinandcohnia sp. SECRCQ15]